MADLLRSSTASSPTLPAVTASHSPSARLAFAESQTDTLRMVFCLSEKRVGTDRPAEGLLRMATGYMQTRSRSGRLCWERRRGPLKTTTSGATFTSTVTNDAEANQTRIFLKPRCLSVSSYAATDHLPIPVWTPSKHTNRGAERNRHA